MRIQIVISSLRIGGAERVACILANAWRRDGHDVCVTLFESNENIPAYALDASIKLVFLDKYRPSKGFADAVIANINRVIALRDAIRSFGPDVIVSFLIETNVISIIASKFAGIPVIVTEHTDPKTHKPGWFWRSLRRTLYGWSTCVIALTTSAKKYFEETTFAKVHLIPNPVQPDNPGGYKDRWRREPNYLITAMGRLSPEKRFDVLMRAFALVVARHNNWSLVIIGEGPERNNLEPLIAALHLQEHVRLPGAMLNPSCVLNQADIFVSSSDLEGFPMAICEAMASGLPVIAVHYGNGIRELIQHDENGRVVDVGNESALAEEMSYLIENPKERERLGKAAVGIRQRYSLEKVMILWDTVFADVLDKDNTIQVKKARRE